MPPDDLPLLVHWERTLGDLLDRTQKFPKSVRFTFSTRIDNLALDVMERLVEARYASGHDKRKLLRGADSALTRLRILLRLCRDRRHLDRGGFEHAMRNLDEAGRMRVRGCPSATSPASTSPTTTWGTWITSPRRTSASAAGFATWTT